MQIMTRYEARIDWSARDYETHEKIKDRFCKIFWGMDKSSDIDFASESFNGCPACGPYIIISCKNRRTIELIGKKLISAIMRYKGSKVLDITY